MQRSFRLVRGHEGLGSGDLKLTAMIGAWLGWEALPGIVFLASLGGVATGLVKRGPFAFGPWLALAGWLALIARDAGARGGRLPLLLSRARSRELGPEWRAWNQAAS